MRLDVEDDDEGATRRNKWRMRLTVAGVLLLASLWLLAITALAVWLATFL
jgi:hypothetical protein